MFFLVSKIFWFVVQPVNLILIVLGFAVLAGRKSASKWSYRFLIAGFAGLLIAAHSPLAYWLALPLEQRFAQTPLPEKVDGIIVIGGGFNTQISADRGVNELDPSGDRIVQGAVLARKFPNANIVYTGGRAGLLHDEAASADLAKSMLIDLGIDAGRITIEEKSRNTYENAVFTRDLINPSKGETWLVVTSAFHMPRTIGIFRKIGWDVVPWPVDYFTGGNHYAGYFFLDPIAALLVLTTMVREWIGLAVYWLTDRTGDLFPGPRERHAGLLSPPSETIRMSSTLLPTLTR